jgi:hypothetical protein
VISASNIACITASPVATLIASSPFRAATSDVRQRYPNLLRQLRQHGLGVGGLGRANSRYGLVPFPFLGVLGGSPETYHQTGQAGTTTSSSTKIETTSAQMLDLDIRLY